MKSILYIGGFNFRDGNASATRVIENTSFLKELNYRVSVLGKILSTKNKFNFIEIDNTKIYDIEYKTSFGKDIASIITYVENIEKPDFIIAYNYPAIAFKKLINYCKKNNIVLIPDLTEWYSIDGKLTINKLYRYLLHEWRMYFLNKSCDNIIVASNYLKNFYKHKNVLILPFVTTKKISFSRINTEKNIVKFVYAGSPGVNFSKDRLDLILNSFSKIIQTNQNFTLDIVGVKKSLLTKDRKTRKSVNILAEKLICHGKLPHSETIEIIKNCNVVTFARDVNRMTSSGFPTKIFEAFKYGLPVMTNATSDIKNYVDSKNGFLVQQNTVKHFSIMIKNILELNSKDFLNITKNVRSNNPFSSFYFKEESLNFFNKIKK